MMIKNKRGNIYAIIIFFVIAFVILFLGFIMLVGSAVLNLVFDEAVPELAGLGMVGDANMTEVASYTITPLNNIVQSFTWLTGVLYVIMLIGSFGVLFIARESPNRWLMGFYVGGMLMLIIGCIIISQIYEDFYNGTDDLATRLKEHVLLSWMILYSPFVFSVIGFIFGALLFSGINQDEVSV